jgi:hypothetical protein
MNKIRFLHIPKTAGTTFTQILKNQFEKCAMFQFSGDIDHDLNRLNALSGQQKELLNIYSGHAPIKTGIEVIDKLDTITFLRDPVARVQSYCRHVFDGKSPKILDLLPNKKFDLDVFLDKGFFELHNLQTKMLINKGDGAAPLKISDYEAINLAVDNLINKLKFFGLVEYFDESLLLFQRQFKWKNIDYSSQNKSAHSQALIFEKRHLKRIKELNQLDIELYNIAKNHFLQMLKTHNIKS